MRAIRIECAGRDIFKKIYGEFIDTPNKINYLTNQVAWKLAFLMGINYGNMESKKEKR
ncbi:MAG: hypothetical protein AABY22_03450 [Nanoarchaeota archaeon]